MIYHVVLEIPQEQITREHLKIVSNWKESVISRYVIYSRVNQGFLLAPTPSSMKSILRLKDNLSKIMNWQLTQSKYYIILWSNDLVVIKNQYVPIVEETFLRAFDTIEESRFKESMTCLQKWFKDKNNGTNYS